MLTAYEFVLFLNYTHREVVNVLWVTSLILVIRIIDFLFIFILYKYHKNKYEQYNLRHTYN